MAEKDLLLIRSDFEDLRSGETIGLQYKLDRNSVWSVESTASYSIDGSITKRLQISKGRHREYQVRLNLATTISTSPAVLGVLVDENLLETEERV